MNNNAKKNLLFFFSDESCPEALAAVPTLAFLAKNKGIDFETYICKSSGTSLNSTLPFTGHLHGEEFAHIANFYNEIYFTSLTEHKTFQFRRQILAWGGKIVSSRTQKETMTFYKEVFDFFQQPLPKQAGVIPDPNPRHAYLVADEAYLTPYFYYDIYQEECLGFTAEAAKQNLDAIKEAGIEKVRTFACELPCETIPVEAAYEFNSGDSYREVTLRIAERWWKKASGICFAEGNVTAHWQAFFLRENRIPIYDPYSWATLVPIIAGYAQKIGNFGLSGTQKIYPRSLRDAKFNNSSDNLFAEFSKYNLTFDAIGMDGNRHGFSIQKKHPLPLDWLEDAKTPWEDEYSDEFLRQKMESFGIPVCFLFYAADLGHLKTLPRILDLLSVPGYRAGLAFPSSWYDYAPELLEQIYIPLAQGGVFPQLEPLLSSGGDTILSESKEAVSPDVLRSHLQAGKKAVARAVGEKMVPRGYYPWQDGNFMYIHDSSTPQFDVVAECGMEYYISYLHSTHPAQILYDKNGMIAFNQPQVEIWLPGGGIGKEVIKEHEANPKQPPYMIMPFDMPFCALAPTYIQGCWKHPHEDKKVGMTAIASAMKYVQNGGKWGQLFMVKPHELARYVRMLKEYGRL